MFSMNRRRLLATTAALGLAASQIAMLPAAQAQGSP